MPTKKEKKVVTSRQSVHVVFFSCPNCGEETEHIQMCTDCGSTMRVIDVVEKFGDEADSFIKKIKTKIDEGTLKPDDLLASKEDSPNIIVLGGDDDLETDDDALTDDTSLGDIYPEDEENQDSSAPEKLTDLDDIVAELDKEEEEGDLSFDDIGEEGLPEL